MIPSIEEILSDLMAGRITYTQARALISRHMEIAEQRGLGDLRDDFAAKAMAIMWDAYDKGYCGVIDPDTFDNDMLAAGAYQIADAMLKARDA